MFLFLFVVSFHSNPRTWFDCFWISFFLIHLSLWGEILHTQSYWLATFKKFKSAKLLITKTSIRNIFDLNWYRMSSIVVWFLNRFTHTIVNYLNHRFHCNQANNLLQNLFWQWKENFLVLKHPSSATIIIIYRCESKCQILLENFSYLLRINY